MKEIDEHNLDREWIAQPKRYREAAELLAEAVADLERAEAHLAVTDAKLALQIREDPTAHGFTKITESMVKEWVLTQPKHQKAVEEVTVAKHKRDMAKALVSSLDHRKSALQNLVSLHLRDYYSEPSTSQEGHEMMAEEGRHARRSAGVRRRRGA